MAVAVRKGAPKPDISTPEAVKRMFLAAKSVSYPDPFHGSPAGMSVQGTLEKLGIVGQVQPKNNVAASGPAAMQLVAKGEVEIGFCFLSEAKDMPGIDVVGTLPAEISARTTLVGFVSAHAKNPAAAQALLDYLTSPEAAAVYKARGMQPGS